MLPVDSAPILSAAASAAAASGGKVKGGLHSLSPNPPQEALERAKAQLREWGVPESADDALTGKTAPSATSAVAPPTSQPPRMCRLIALVYVNFTKGTLLKGTIAGKAESNVGRFQEEFASAAVRFLQGFYSQRLAAIKARREPRRLADAAGASPLPTVASAAAPRQLSSGSGAAYDSGARQLPPLMHPQLAAIRSSSSSGGGDPRLMSPVGSGVGDFLSPTAAAAFANPALAIPRDALMASWLQPSKASAAPHGELVRQYTQLYASHEALLGQSRRLHDSVRRASDGSAAAESPAFGTRHANGTATSDGGWGKGASSGGSRNHWVLDAAVRLFSLGWLPAPARAAVVLLFMVLALLHRPGPAHPGKPVPLAPATLGPGVGFNKAPGLSGEEERVVEAVWRRLQAQMQGLLTAGRTGGPAAGAGHGGASAAGAEQWRSPTTGSGSDVEL